MKSPAKVPTGSRDGHEPKEICPRCNQYMYKQSIRTYVKDKPGWWPVSWVCLYCGHMTLDKKRFDTVKKQLPTRVINGIAEDLSVDPNSELFREWVKTIDTSLD